jgi:hypothetical protein
VQSVPHFEIEMANGIGLAVSARLNQVKPKRI